MRKNKTSDWIYLHDLRLKCRVGVSPRERRNKQIIIADIAIKCDLRLAGKSDCLKDTINYAWIVKAIDKIAKKQSFYLLESVAENIAAICLANKKAEEVVVKVGKKNSLPAVRCAGVEIHRGRMEAGRRKPECGIRTKENILNSDC